MGSDQEMAPKTVLGRVMLPEEFDRSYATGTLGAEVWGCATVSWSRLRFTMPLEVALDRPARGEPILLDFSDELLIQKFGEMPIGVGGDWIIENRVYGTTQAAMEAAVEMGHRVSTGNKLRDLIEHVPNLAEIAYGRTRSEAIREIRKYFSSITSKDKYMILRDIFRSEERLFRYLELVRPRKGVQVIIGGEIPSAFLNMVARKRKFIDDRGVSLEGITQIQNSLIVALIPLGEYERQKFAELK